MSSGADLDSWYHEKESAWLYREVARAEPDPRKRELFLKLAAAAEEQATHWQSRPAGPTRAERTFKPSLRARIVAQLVQRFGPRSLRGALAAMKLRGLSVYSMPQAAMPQAAMSQAAVPQSAVAQGAALPAVGHAMPTSASEVGARHRSSVGGNLRAAVFGVNDGLISNASLVMGVAGAGAPGMYVLTAGAAGLLAGALSMAAGEYVSVRSQREMYEYQIALEREEVAEYPEEEAEELALIYEARGIALEQAREMSRALLARPEQALDVLTREELGLNPDDLGSPLRAAGFSFLAFALGASVPLTPFLVGQIGTRAVLAAALTTLCALFAVGMALSLFTGRAAWLGGLRMVLIGGGAGIVSFGVGRLLGGALR
ncbi:MAG TPA: VIT1/CCC1 transporter family protein [Steroidobacteraceae bacterium]|nr:VIT1/CCC1 transporter family protein [Steroidobacteraceae bacterium]